MKITISIFLLIFLNMPNIFAYEKIYGELNEVENKVLNFGNNKCQNNEDYSELDIPTIFIPGILASWYSEEGFKNSKIKRWIPDPVTHSYDTLFYTFKENGYNIRDVFYTDEFNTYIDGNPQGSLFLFGYDWKKDNKVTANLLSDLIIQIRKKYEKDNGCDIGTVNIVAHSMGGLVARAMLEDMCASDESVENYYDRANFEPGQIPDFVNTKCNFTKINKLITISTPHRGSPSSFPLWEKGNLGQTDGFIKSELLKRQLGKITNDGLYKLIHAYDEKVPNGIITIGQLLPDVQNINEYNKKLLYLEQDGEKFSNNIHSRNSFLEELNSVKNIDKLISNISGKYKSHYSNLTGNNKSNNNTIGFIISKYYKSWVYNDLSRDLTKDHKGIFIYDKYLDKPLDNIYNINKNIRNQTKQGGDGTVPTYNLKLIGNNDFLGKESKYNGKFISDELKCYIDNWKDIKDEVNNFKNYGEFYMEMCSHTKTPIGLATKIYEEISGKETKEKLDYYIGYLEYYRKEEKKICSDDFGGGEYCSTYNINHSIDNLQKTSDLLDTQYIKLFNTQLGRDKRLSVNKRILLDFSGKGGQWGALLRYEILSPINILIEDEKGRKIGIDPDTGMIINEIPGAWTSGDTEGSREPEFFLIPRTGTGQIMHKINTFGTGDGEYHIVMEEIKKDSSEASSSEEKEQEQPLNLVIAGVAKKGEEEKYVVGIEGNKAGFTKVNSSSSKILKEAELDKKYKDVFEKIINIIEMKYDYKRKQTLKNRLEKFVLMKNSKFMNDEKLKYLVGKIYEYLVGLGY